MISSSDLLTIIDHNVATKPKPYHHNRDLMTCALQLENAGISPGTANVRLSIKTNKKWWQVWR